MLIDHALLGFKLPPALRLIQFGLFVRRLQPVGFGQPQAITLLGEPDRKNAFERLFVLQLGLQDSVTLPAIGDRQQ